nr:uncharacterized protein LOC129490659 [Symphalangus syndactylus]
MVIDLPSTRRKLREPAKHKLGQETDNKATRECQKRTLRGGFFFPVGGERFRGGGDGGGSAVFQLVAAVSGLAVGGFRRGDRARMAAAAAGAGSGPWAAQEKQFPPALLSFFIYNPRFEPREGENSGDPELQPVLAGLFLSMCLVTVLGNLLLILAVSPDSHLHTPMYFFLSNLSLPDIGFTSSTVPKMIVDVQSHGRVISCAGCLTQMSLFAIFGGTEERHAPECDGL